MHRHIKPTETHNWITVLSWRVDQRNAKVVLHFRFHRHRHIADAPCRWFYKLPGGVSDLRDPQSGFLSATQLGVADGAWRLGRVDEQILASAESGAHRPLWRNIRSHLGFEIRTDLLEKIRKNIIGPFSIRAI